MSSLTIMDLELTYDLLSLLLDEPPARRSRAEEEEATRRREEEQRRHEERIREFEREADERYEKQMEVLEKKRRAYVASVLQEREKALEQQNDQLERIRNAARQILREASGVASSYLADYSNLVFSRELYEQLAVSRQQIERAARDILSESSFRDRIGAASGVQDLEERIGKLKAAWDDLRRAALQAKADDEEAQERAEELEKWLDRLSDGADTLRRTVAIFPELPEDDAAQHADAMAEALGNLEYYAFGPATFYLTESARKEVLRIYGIPENPEEFSGIPDWAEEDVKERNARFTASHRRALDHEIFTMRSEIARGQDKYGKLRRRLGITEESEVEIGDFENAQQMLSALDAAVGVMERRYRARVQREVVQSVVDRALRSAKQGMAVRRIGEEETAAGNWRAMYQIGQNGTTIEVYADARGQVTIEAGALLDGGSQEPTPAQTKAIIRNNEQFCSRDLPAIVERLNEELEAADEDAHVELKEMRGASHVQVFSAEKYPGGTKSGYVLREDGTAAAAGSSKPAAERPRTMELDS